MSLLHFFFGTNGKTMRKRWTILLAIILLSPSFLSAENSDELRIAGERLNVRLKQDAKGCAKGRALSVLLGPWSSYVSEICNAQKNLAHLVKQTPLEELPAALVNAFIDELNGRPPREQYPPMEDYLVIFGDPAVAQLVARYEEAPENRRGDILRALGEIGSEKALPLIRSELRKLNPLTLPLAAYAVRKINKEAANDDLLPLLRDPRIDADAVTAIVRHLIYNEDPGWHEIVLDLAQDAKIPFQTVRELASYDKYPEAAVTTHTDYLLARWAAGDCDTVACLLYQTHTRSAVKQWLPLLEDLLRAKFAYANRRYSPLTVRCEPFRHYGRHPLLDRIENTLTLTDVEEWIRQPSLGWLSYLYLRELRQKMGGPSFDAGKLDFRLTISVHDDDNDILLGEVSDQFQSGVDRLIDLPVKGSNNAPYRISLAPRLQKDITIENRWVIKIPLFNIDKPIGCAFPLTVPMGSSAAGRTQAPSGRIIKWQVRHIGPPPVN
jgi:hypothetical protein